MLFFKHLGLLRDATQIGLRAQHIVTLNRKEPGEAFRAVDFRILFLTNCTK